MEFKKIGDYEIVEKIGAGGMATVYKGIQTSLNRPVAIKVLSKMMTENKEVVERFKQEALIIARLTHPHIIHIIDRGIIEDMHYFVMDYIEGKDFATIIKNKELDSKRMVDIVVQVCKGLSYAHKNGVIHRDIKPANIIVDREGNGMLMDFGIAQLRTGHADGNLTTDGALMGTMAYMSPEQKTDSGKVSPATDIYSLGVVMYEMFTGTKPLGRFKLPSEINPKFPKPLESVILKCLEQSPEDRYLSADELRDELLKMLKGAHIKTEKREQAFQGITKLEDKFSLLDIIKETPYGTVYMFEKKENKQLMVIKKIRKRNKGLTESKILSKLSHDNIAKIYGVSGDEKLFIVVMEYLNGGSLKERLVRNHTYQETLKIGKEICEGLSFAHKNRVIHGNLRPSNILFNESGQVKVSDFGLDDHYTGDAAKANWYYNSNIGQSEKGDVYSVGVILYEMLTGAIPSWKENRIAQNDIFDLLPGRVQKVILRMLEHDPAKQYPGIDSAIDEIGILCREPEAKEAKKKSRIGIITFLLLCLLLTAGGLYLYMTGNIGFYMELIENLLKSYGLLK
ncbi:MAG: serine/threonine protein kinase [Nitrospinae bacterium]|nr:serine/threonine protein kinase [Nitrospinota bacterium]